MKKKASFKLNEKDTNTVNNITSSFKELKEILQTSISYISEATEEQNNELDEIIDIAEENGYYPFISFYLINPKFQEPILEDYDKDILYIKMLEYEIKYFNNVNESVKKDIQDRLTKVKGYL